VLEKPSKVGRSKLGVRRETARTLLFEKVNEEVQENRVETPLVVVYADKRGKNWGGMIVIIKKLNEKVEETDGEGRKLPGQVRAL